ncbi:hypothetical protein [Hymenobacter convexus]|uniref:hypothetical protein n=1 Tax=Hymenobacter sp. CA1UV-4 TaxID=3063782 RepID=UPI0027124BCF|nr:hypothetical protein [Hymenobacter sp. CA1UV-4]MDO7851594.1 hypothetical protein [Hymenobacter sp. CA1UV-4]
MPNSKAEKARGPKTALDEKFLAVARQVMKARGITSDRGISLELGRSQDFINRVQNGFQSATPDAWDTLLSKYPEAAAINQSQVTGIAVGVNNGVAAHTYTMADCEKERDDARAERDALKKENELLRQQLAMQTELIAAKDETLALLRGGHNRPN